MSMKPGDTFLADIGCGAHLHVVLPYPTGEDQLVVVVMVSTYDENYKNTSCVLRSADGHPFIKHSSYVAYNTAQLLRISALEELPIKKKQPFSETVLQRILKGADSWNSDFPNKCWIILDEQGLIPK